MDVPESISWPRRQLERDVERIGQRGKNNRGNRITGDGSVAIVAQKCQDTPTLIEEHRLGEPAISCDKRRAVGLSRLARRHQRRSRELMQRRGFESVVSIEAYPAGVRRRAGLDTEAHPDAVKA